MLIVVRLRKRWMSLETGRVGDENEPKGLDDEEDEEKDQEQEKPTKLKFGFSSERADD